MAKDWELYRLLLQSRFINEQFRNLMRAATLILLLLFSVASYSESIKNLYQLTMPCANQSDEAKTLAFDQAMAIELQRLTGINTFDELPDAKETEQFVSQYHFSQEGDKNFIAISFDSTALNAWIADHNLITWPQERPSLLTLIALMSENDQKLLGNNASSSIVKELENQANMRGLPLIFPEMDLEDVSLFNFNDVWNHNHSMLTKANKRYESDGILSIQLIQIDKTQFQSVWQLNIKGEEYRFQIKDDDINKLVTKGLNLISEELRPKEKSTQATVLPPSHQVLVEIANINDVENYTELMDYLQQLNGVVDVELDKVTPRTVLYKLDINIETKQLQEQLDNSKTLVHEATGKSTNDNVLHYQLKT